MAPHDPGKLITRRRVFFLALLGAFIPLGVAAWLAASGSNQIRVGMTRAEVDARLGPPDGRMLAVGTTAITDDVYVWKDRGFVIEFDPDNRVRVVTQPPSLFDRLSNKIGF